MLLPLGYVAVAAVAFYLLFTTAGPGGVTPAALLGTVFGLFLLGLVVIGLRFPGSGAQQLDWDPHRRREPAEDEIAPVLERINAARARDGRAPISEQELRAEAEADLDGFWPRP